MGERVMHLGEAVAVVIADSAQIAQDAAEFVHVEYEELTPVVDARDALKPGAPQIWADVPGNLALDWPGPQADTAANAAISATPTTIRHVVSGPHIGCATQEFSSPLIRIFTYSSFALYS